ncbi:hypothetical protein HDU91_001268, partial [Kappamyces sp. JEL0680]
MERVKKAGGNLLDYNWGETSSSAKALANTSEAAPAIPITNPDVTRYISKEEVAEHKSAADCWFICKGQVYDATRFLNDHPGGPESILMSGGQDVTEDFFAIHSENAVKMLKDYHIGILMHSLHESRDNAAKELSPTFLSELVWKKATLVKKTAISPDTTIFRYQLEHEEQLFGLVCGKHVFIRTKDLENKFVMRAYTPISSPDMKGYFELLVKVYRPLPPRFPNGGKMSQLLEAQIPNMDQIEVKGPVGSFQYLGQGKCLYKGNEFNVTDFGMVAAGSGITPIIQVLRAIMIDEGDKTKCWMFDANNTFDDILCKDDLDKWHDEKKHQLSLQYVLSRPEEDWTGYKGFLNKDILQAHLPTPTAHMKFLICGPPPLVDVIKKATAELGWTEDQIVVF